MYYACVLGSILGAFALATFGLGAGLRTMLEYFSLESPIVTLFATLLVTLLVTLWLGLAFGMPFWVERRVRVRWRPNEHR